MSEQILEQYGRVTIYTEANHPSPIYHVEGDIQPNPYGDLAALFEDDALVLNATTGLVQINSQWGLCPNLGVCFLEFVNTGLRSGDIVDGFDDMTYQDGLGPWFDRIIYALAFHVDVGELARGEEALHRAFWSDQHRPI